MALNFKISRIAIAISFSPNTEALLAETVREAKLHNSKIYFIHVGPKTSDKEVKLLKLAEKYNLNNIEISWKTGSTVKAVVEACTENKIDLLIAGALVKENTLKYYLGSIARQLIRKAKCHVLLLRNPQKKPIGFNRVCINLGVNTGDKHLDRALDYCKIEVPKKVFITKECQLHGFKRMMNEDLPEEEMLQLQKDMVREEHDHIAFADKNAKLSGLNYTIRMLYGKPGIEIKHYVQAEEIDLLIINAPLKKYGLIDRIFQHDIEFLLEDLPSDLLMIQN